MPVVGLSSGEFATSEQLLRKVECVLDAMKSRWLPSSVVVRIERFCDANEEGNRLSFVVFESGDDEER